MQSAAAWPFCTESKAAVRKASWAAAPRADGRPGRSAEARQPGDGHQGAAGRDRLARLDHREPQPREAAGQQAGIAEEQRRHLAAQRGQRRGRHLGADAGGIARG